MGLRFWTGAVDIPNRRARRARRAGGGARGRRETRRERREVWVTHGQSQNLNR